MNDEESITKEKKMLIAYYFYKYTDLIEAIIRYRAFMNPCVDGHYYSNRQRRGAVIITDIEDCLNRTSSFHIDIEQRKTENRHFIYYQSVYDLYANKLKWGNFYYKKIMNYDLFQQAFCIFIPYNGDDFYAHPIYRSLSSFKGLFQECLEKNKGDFDPIEQSFKEFIREQGGKFSYFSPPYHINKTKENPFPYLSMPATETNPIIMPDESELFDGFRKISKRKTMFDGLYENLNFLELLLRP